MSSPADPPAGALSPDALLGRLEAELPRPRRYWLGFSGGLDSTVLLHLLARIRARLAAPVAVIHVDHGLHPAAADWRAHCERRCRELDLHCVSLTVDASAATGESPEAVARAARYRALAEQIGEHEMLLTAHHLDDQAETLLLQLLRGAGVDGLAAMPLVRAWAGGWHARPLLDVPRATIHAWALAERLAWIDDPSNAQLHADRNYLRHRLMPVLLQRWPGARAGLTRSAAHCADAARAVTARTVDDLRAVQSADGERLDIAALRALDAPRRHLLVREWLRHRGAPALAARRLDEAIRQLLLAAADRAPSLRWSGFELRRYRGAIWLLGPRPTQMPAWRPWEGDAVDLGAGLGRVRRVLGPGGIDRRLWTRGRVEIGYRRDGFRCRLAGRAGGRSFKKIAQDFAIPPWQRAYHPIVYIDGEPAAIANCCVCEPFAAADGAHGWHIEWVTTRGAVDDCAGID